MSFYYFLTKISKILASRYKNTKVLLIAILTFSNDIAKLMDENKNVMWLRRVGVEEHNREWSR